MHMRLYKDSGVTIDGIRDRVDEFTDVRCNNIVLYRVSSM